MKRYAFTALDGAVVAFSETWEALCLVVVSLVYACTGAWLVDAIRWAARTRRRGDLRYTGPPIGPSLAATAQRVRRRAETS